MLVRMKDSMNTFRNNPSVDGAIELFDAFFEFACGEDIDVETLRKFTTDSSNMDTANEILADLATYFQILMCDLNNVYEDDGLKEYKFYKLCCLRSGLETFIELFEARLKDNYEKDSYNDWYNVTLELPEFDKKFKAKLREFPLLRKSYIPENILDTHWWFQHPSKW